MRLRAEVALSSRSRARGRSKDTIRGSGKVRAKITGGANPRGAERKEVEQVEMWVEKKVEIERWRWRWRKRWKWKRREKRSGGQASSWRRMEADVQEEIASWAGNEGGGETAVGRICRRRF